MSRATDGASAIDESAPVDRRAEQLAGEEAQDRMFSCLEERGFRVDRAADGSAEIHGAEGDQEDALLRSAMRECEEVAGFPKPVPLSVAEIDQLYDLSLAAEECLRENGYHPSVHPTREQFREDYQAMQQGSGGVSAWFPHDGVHDPEAEKACPQPSLARPEDYLDAGD